MHTYARVSDGLVHELFSTEGDITEMFHPDLIWVDITRQDPAPVVGWSATESADGWLLSEPVVPPPTDAELKLEAMAQRDVLLSIADEATVGMADAFIAGLLEDDDVARFKAFAAYKLALNKIDKQPRYPQEIFWPLAPT